MLTFVIPLKSRQVSTNWHEVGRLLEMTLHSACRQTSNDYQVLVVCHEQPALGEFPRVSFVEAPAAAPNADLLRLPPKERIFRLHTDKGRKLLRGLEVARQQRSDYVMFVDGDDLVSRRLCEFVHRQSHPHGWVMHWGYRMDEGLPGVAFRRSRFNHECGTSHVLRTEKAIFPAVPDYSADLNDDYVRRYVVHAYVADAMARHGCPLARLPFYGAVYYLNREAIYSPHLRSKESILRKAARYLLKGRPVTAAFREEFGIPQSRASISET